MAAEMVGSAVAQEAVNEVLSRIKEGYAEKSDAKEHIERMEMAHIKLEAALETSHKWNISSVALLRWQSKLKPASQECDHTLRGAWWHTMQIHVLCASYTTSSRWQRNKVLLCSWGPTSLTYSPAL